MSSSDGPRWWVFAGGIILGGAVSLATVYAVQHYWDDTRGASDDLQRRQKARRHPARPTRPTRPVDTKSPHNGHPLHSPTKPIPPHDATSEADWQETEFSDAPARLVGDKYLSGAGPTERTQQARTSGYQQTQTVVQATQAQSSPTKPAGTMAPLSRAPSLGGIHKQGTPGPSSAAGAAGANAAAHTLTFKVDNPPLPLPIPSLAAQQVTITPPPPSHVIHSTSDMIQEGKIIEDAALHDQYCRVITPEPALNEEQEDVCAQLRDAFELRFKWLFQPQTSPEAMDSKEAPTLSAVLQDPFTWAPCERSPLEARNVEGVICVFDPESGEEVFPLPGSATSFFTDMHRLLKMTAGGSVRSFCHHRLVLLEQKFNLHVMLNADKEFLAQKTAPHRDFYNVRKVDTHVHHSACMHQKHLLRFIKSKLRKEPDELVIFRDGKYLTLKEVFESLKLTAYDLNVDTLDMHADKNIFHRFDKFNLKYNPCGQSRLREIFIKQDNIIHGRFLAELTREVFSDLQASKYQHAEYRISIYGRKQVEWDILAAWVVNNKLYSDNVLWLIQIPRLYNVYKEQGIVEDFAQLLDNIFKPLFEVTLDPNTHPQLHLFLKMVVGFDVVDDESRPERRPVKHMPTPTEWNHKHNPAYSYYAYYIYANIYTLNKLRESRGFNTFAFRPHAGEAGDIDHLVSSFMLAHNINHGINLRKSPAMQYLYYLAQIGLCMSPLSNNSLFLDYHRNPFPVFFARGLSCSLSTDDPLQIHLTKEPLVEEYSVAAQVWKLSATDLSEIARNSVLHSGFPHQVKKHWVSGTYWKMGPEGNDIHKTNVPNLRMRFRADCHQEEMNLVFGGAYAHERRIKALQDKREAA